MKPTRLVVAAAAAALSVPLAVTAASADEPAPPTVTITSPVDGDVFGVGDIVVPQFACSPGTNPVVSCASDPENPDLSLGEHEFSVTATDSAGLTTTETVRYEVVRRTQSVAFTSVPPAGVRWGRTVWFVEAESSAGLPVTISFDPASTACGGPPAEAVPFVQVLLSRAGTCILHADQAGNGQYAPAERVTHSFEVGKLNSYVSTTKASKGLLGLTPTTFRAELDVDGFFGPSAVVWGHPGGKVTFAIGGKPVCSGIAVLQPSPNPFDRTAVATCKATIGVGNALRNSYTASFAGDEDYLPSSATGKLQ